ncbi:MAG TPA: nucleotidyltransferase family protein, partial [Coleofasciculaceae cyanobacterium]
MHTTLFPTSVVGTRPEIELLLCCTRTYLDFEKAEQLKNLLEKDIDWTYLTQLALRHGVMPLLYFNLNNTCPNAVSKTTLEQYRSYFHTNTLHNLFLTSELLKLLNMFAEHGIPAIPYKGPVLAASVYGNITLRQFCDLDLLVHTQDFQKSRELLISQGYRHWHELGWEAGFINDNNRVHIDLHQRITPWYFPFQLDFDRLWQCLEPICLASTTVVNLSAEDLLLILCVQFSRDCFAKREQLIKICDIAELLRTRPTLDWKQVMEQAQILGCKRMLFLGLFLANHLLGAALPDDVLQKIQTDLAVKSLGVQICDRMWQSKDCDRLVQKGDILPNVFKGPL